MWKTMRQAWRATCHLAKSALMTLGTYLFICVLLITATGTVAVIGVWLLPETAHLIRDIAGAKRRQVAAWTGRPIPEA